MNFVLPWIWLRSIQAVLSTRERREHKAEHTLDIIVSLLKFCFAQNVLPYLKHHYTDRRIQETGD